MGFAARRRDREPVAYILGRKGFRAIELAVDARVLIPRPETEFLVEAALDLPRGARVWDVGTGSGAVALALKQERPDLELTGTDTSPEALEVARANADRLGLEVRWLEGDLLAGITDVDAVLSNPPYVEDGARLAPDVAAHEPALALRAGPDGLDVLRRLAPAVGSRAPRSPPSRSAPGQAADVPTCCARWASPTPRSRATSRGSSGSWSAGGERAGPAGDAGAVASWSAASPRAASPSSPPTPSTASPATPARPPPSTGSTRSRGARRPSPPPSCASARRRPCPELGPRTRAAVGSLTPAA